MPFGNAAGLRLKRASGPFQWESAFQAEPERSGNRTRDTMINSHLLYPTELSFVAQETGIEPIPSGFTPMLSMSYVLHPCNGGTRNRKPARASRDHNEPEPMAKAKERVNKRNIFQLQER